MSSMKKQTPLFLVVLTFEDNEDERPKEGWKIYDMTPSGKKPATTRRGRVVKFKRLKEMFSWLQENRNGYFVQFDGLGYKGELQPIP